MQFTQTWRATLVVSLHLEINNAKNEHNKSTDAELMGSSDYLPNTIWIKLFMDAQDHKMDEIVFQQYTESSIWMETNGRMSAWQKSSHINIRYFWIKDHIKGLEIANFFIVGWFLHQTIEW